MSSHTSSRREKGIAGEDKAARYLEEHGFEIVARNYRTRTGEIDIIAEKGDYLVFFEVKRLPGGNADFLAGKLDGTKRKKIIETSKSYLQNNRQYNGRLIRYDVLAIDVPGFQSVHHIENAFSEQ